MKKNIIFIFGTRPEVIKLSPLILTLRQQKTRYQVIVCNTEQQREMSAQTLKYFGIKPDITLAAMLPNQSLATLTVNLMNPLQQVFQTTPIDAVVVQGDTLSCFLGALCGFYFQKPIFHIEAGLRSYDLKEPFPEEALRQMVSRIASLHFAPTIRNQESLQQENINPKTIHVVGNTGIDALNYLSAQALAEAKLFLQQQGITINNQMVLVTVHRRENHQTRLNHIIAAILQLAKEFPKHQFILPVHPNPNVKHVIEQRLGKEKNIFLLPPLDYPYLVFLMQQAVLILTDSGGIQEEAPSFQCPTLVLRYETERPEGITIGATQLVGADTEKIITKSRMILNQPKNQTRLKLKENPYGDGLSAVRIEKIIWDYLENQHH